MADRRNADACDCGVSYYPANAETTTHSSYVIRKERADRFIPGKKVVEDVGFNCIRCGNVNRDIYHGEHTHCECGLTFILFGNGLMYWE